MKKLKLILLLVAICLPASVSADWTSFRNGGSSSACALPLKWSPETVAWQKELTGYGQSTPVIRDGQVFVASVVGPMKETCLVECLDLASGEEHWRYECAAAKSSPSNYMASRAAPTPVVDSHGVYAFFENGDLIAVDLDGNKMWHRVLTDDYGEFENNHGLGSSPAQNTTHLFLNIEHKGPSYLVAIRKSDGASEWKVERPSGSSWTSPIVVDSANSEQVIVSSAGNVASYEAVSGRELWSIEGLDGNSVPSPTHSQNKLFVGARLPEFAEEGSVRANCCLQLGGALEEAPQIVWRAEKAISDYASPVSVGNYVYFINKSGVLHCLEAASGELHYRQRLNGPCWATPIVSGTYVYLFCKDGSTQVIKAGDQFQEAATNRLWDAGSPPHPEHYVEFNGHEGHGHGQPEASKSPESGAAARPALAKHGTESKAADSASRTRGRPGGGMIAAMMRGDANGDGTLDGDEISEDFRPMLPRIDTNGDGKLDSSELEAMAKSFAARRANAQSGARDPIVYGAAASDGAIVIRTGTRLYCVRD